MELSHGIFDDFTDGYTGKIALENGTELTLYHGGLFGVTQDGKEIPSAPSEKRDSENSIDTMLKAPSGKIKLDSHTIVTLNHGRIMRVEKN